MPGLSVTWSKTSELSVYKRSCWKNINSGAPEGEETEAGDIGRSRSASSAILEESAKLQRLARKASRASFSSSTPRACVKDWYPCNHRGSLVQQACQD